MKATYERTLKRTFLFLTEEKKAKLGEPGALP